MNHEFLAQENFEWQISENPYPGRGLVIGRTSEGKWLILY